MPQSSPASPVVKVVEYYGCRHNTQSFDAGHFFGSFAGAESERYMEADDFIIDN